MKQPRVTDFDPHAQEKPLKSSMDDFPAIQSQQQKIPADDAHTTVPPVPRTGKRKIKQRHPFDIYQDQYETLKDLADKERRNGGIGSMSAMVREAIDNLIAQKRA